MDRGKAGLTVFFEEPFWVGVFERVEDGRLSVCRVNGKFDREAFILAIKQADRECGSCGCEMDPLYKMALELI